MRVKNIVDEDFVNYRKPSMFIGTVSCGGKCCYEADLPLSVCQNDGWRKSAPIFLDDCDLCLRYLQNEITSAIVFGGLEPFEQADEVIGFIQTLRESYRCMDEVVIYTGYDRNEIEHKINALKQFPNIIVKFGRFIPNEESHFDDVLGVSLSSPNQYAERIS